MLRYATIRVHNVAHQLYMNINKVAHIVVKPVLIDLRKVGVQMNVVNAIPVVAKQINKTGYLGFDSLGTRYL